MKQNKYDEPEFFGNYSQMPRSVCGLDAASEWPAFCSLLPDLGGNRVLDLGCGFGWHCRFARDQGAESVVGVDISEKMLERARAMTDDAGISYRRTAIEDIDFEPASFDVAISSLAMHYVDRFEAACRKIYVCLASGGVLVMSVEHPMFTSRAEQDWHRGPNGDILHWPVDNYLEEGERRTSWLADNVVKYHRTVATYVNTLTGSGFRIASLLEPAPPPSFMAQNPAWNDEIRRPMFLIIGASKQSA